MTLHFLSMMHTQKTYKVRDGSDWELTLKPRLQKRLKVSKNIILFLSSNTRSSKVLREEIKYGACRLGLPIIVVYPELDDDDIAENNNISLTVRELWNKLPILRTAMENVPTIHIPMKKESLQHALSDSELTIQGKIANNHTQYFYHK